MRSDVVIVGGGIIGLYSAYLLALNGVKLTLIDRSEFGQESSWAAGGILTPLLPWNYNDKTLFLTEHSLQAYKELSQEVFDNLNCDIGYWKCGLSVITTEIESIKNWCITNKHAYDIEKSLSRINLTDVSQVKTPQLLKCLVKQVQLLGVNLLPNTNVSHIFVENNKITGLSTSAGKLESPNIIWTTGAWTSDITSNQIDIRTPKIIPIKGQMLALESNTIRLNTILYKNGHYLIPRKDGLILAGSTIEDVGYDNSTTSEARDTLWKKSIDIMPELGNSRIAHHWSGLRPGTDQSIPTIGPHQDISGLYFNCGHFRYGITMAPKSCEILNSWILNNGDGLNEMERSYSKFK